MWLLIVEALIALALLLFVIWWTMFHGRRRGERVREDDEATAAPGDRRDPPV